MNLSNSNFCFQLLQNAKDMTTEFPPFVRGMGPAASYWASIPLRKPQVIIVERFIKLLDDTKNAILIALSNKETRSKDLLAGLDELKIIQKHIQLHPVRERELRSNIRQLAVKAKQFEVSHVDRYSFIRGKIRFELGHGIGDVEYIIFQSEIKRIIRKELSKKRTFVGENIASTFANISRVVSPSQVIDLSVLDKGKFNEIIGFGDTKEAAQADAITKTPEGAKITSTTLISESKNGKKSIIAYTESDARQLAKKLIPTDAIINRVKCIKSCLKGLWGIGRRDGEWEISWSLPFMVKVIYDSPIHITVQYVPIK